MVHETNSNDLSTFFFLYFILQKAGNNLENVRIDFDCVLYVVCERINGATNEQTNERPFEQHYPSHSI